MPPGASSRAGIKIVKTRSPNNLKCPEPELTFKKIEKNKKPQDLKKCTQTCGIEKHV